MVHVGTLAHARDALRLENFDADVVGLAVGHRPKADPDTRALIVIAVTANALYGDRERALAAGCADHVTKPIEPEGLLRSVERHLQGTGR